MLTEVKRFMIWAKRIGVHPSSALHEFLGFQAQFGEREAAGRVRTGTRPGRRQAPGSLGPERSRSGGPVHRSRCQPGAVRGGQPHPRVQAARTGAGSGHALQLRLVRAVGAGFDQQRDRWRGHGAGLAVRSADVCVLPHIGCPGRRGVPAAARLMKEVLGPEFVLSRFTLQHTVERGVGRLEHLVRGVGVRPEFGARSNSLSFDGRLLALRLPPANPVTVAMCERACEELLERRRARLGTGEFLRQYLEAAPLNMAPDLHHAARALGLSDRTFKRRLQEEGLTFRGLSAEVRGRQANQLLEDETLSLTDIAERMGFSDLSSFSQAYKRWFGVAPSVGRGSSIGLQIVGYTIRSFEEL